MSKSTLTFFGGRWRVLAVISGVAGALNASGVTVEDVQAVNVTPSSFSILWRVDEPAAAVVEVFLDPDGSQPVAGLRQEPFPIRSGDPEAVDAVDRRLSVRNLQSASRNLHLRHIQVSECEPGATYYYRLKNTSFQGTEVVWPESGPLPPVTTPRQTSFIENAQQVILTLTQGEVPGQIVTLSSAGASHALAAVVGDGGGPDQVYFNLTDLFDLSGDGSFIPVGEQEFELAVMGSAGVEDGGRYQLNFTSGFQVGAPSEGTVGSGEFASVGFNSAFFNAGGTAEHALAIQSGVALKSLSLTFDLSHAVALEDLGGASLNPSVANVSLTMLSETRARLDIEAVPGQAIQGSAPLAALSFSSQEDADSALVKLRPVSAQAIKLDDAPFNNLMIEGGRIVLIGERPILEARRGLETGRAIAVYGRVGKTYEVQRSAALGAGASWRAWRRVLMAEMEALFPEAVTGESYFYRVAELASNQPILEIAKGAGSTVNLTVFGQVNNSYQVEGSPVLTSEAVWSPVGAVTLTNSIGVIEGVTIDTEIQFFRLREEE